MQSVPVIHTHTLHIDAWSPALSEAIKQKPETVVSLAKRVRNSVLSLKSIYHCAHHGLWRETLGQTWKGY